MSSYATLDNYHSKSPGIVGGESFSFAMKRYSPQVVISQKNPLGTNSLAKLTGQDYQPVDKAYPMNCPNPKKRNCSQ